MGHFNPETARQLQRAEEIARDLLIRIARIRNYMELEAANG